MVDVCEQGLALQKRERCRILFVFIPPIDFRLLSHYNIPYEIQTKYSHAIYHHDGICESVWGHHL